MDNLHSACHHKVLLDGGHIQDTVSTDHSSHFESIHRENMMASMETLVHGVVSDHSTDSHQSEEEVVEVHGCQSCHQKSCCRTIPGDSEDPDAKVLVVVVVHSEEHLVSLDGNGRHETSSDRNQRKIRSRAVVSSNRSDSKIHLPTVHVHEWLPSKVPQVFACTHGFVEEKQKFP